MNREAPFAARIAFRLPQSLYDKLESWAEEEDRPLANLVYTIVKKAATDRERSVEKALGDDGQANAAHPKTPVSPVNPVSR